MDLCRLETLIGTDSANKLRASSVAIVGLGGVGGICAESLARCGIGKIAICDGDVVDSSNINRQIVATSSTIGINKAIALKSRLEDINPDALIAAYEKNWNVENDFIKDGGFDFVVDAIDSVDDKVNLICMCKANNIKIVSAMGAGCRMNGNMFAVVDIYKTFNDPLAKKIRNLLKKEGVEALDVVCSSEKPQKAVEQIGSAMFSVGASGLMLSEHVVKKIIGKT